MTDAQALLRAILESPSDDLPRLAYADLMEEAGGDDALITTIREGRPDRVRRGDEGCPPFTELAERIGGLVVAVTCSLRNWFIGRHKLLAACPVVRRVTLLDERDWFSFCAVSNDGPLHAKARLIARYLGYGARYSGTEHGTAPDQIMVWCQSASVEVHRHGPALADVLKDIAARRFTAREEFDAALSEGLLGEAREFARLSPG